MKNKVEIDWETKEPTGRIFTVYPFELAACKLKYPMPTWAQK